MTYHARDARKQARRFLRRPGGTVMNPRDVTLTYPEPRFNRDGFWGEVFAVAQADDGWSLGYISRDAADYLKAKGARTRTSLETRA